MQHHGVLLCCHWLIGLEDALGVGDVLGRVVYRGYSALRFVENDLEVHDRFVYVETS